MNQLSTIISGGQTGADRGALDAAIELGIKHGGCSLGASEAAEQVRAWLAEHEPTAVAA